MITTNQINWVAGILEGEGSFLIAKTPTIALNMTDKDTVLKIRNIMCPSRQVYEYVSNTRPSDKNLFRFTLHSREAVEWMMTLYSLMSIRRKTQIRKALDWWRISRQNNTTNINCTNGHPYTKKYRDYTFDSRGNKTCLHCRRARNKWQ